MKSKNTFCDFTEKVNSLFGYTYNNPVFTYGNVRRLEINGKHAYLWLDTKGGVNYSFNLLNQDFHTTSAAKIGNALSSHFQLNIEAVNNISESYKKLNSSMTGLNKAMADSQRHSDYIAFTGGALNTHSSQGENELLALIPSELGLQQQTPQQQSFVPNQPVEQPSLNQDQIHQDIINLSVFQVEYNKQTYFIHLNELPIVHEEKFTPSSKQAFYILNGLTIRNKYSPSEHSVKNLFNQDVHNSFILSFIFTMANNDLDQVMNILAWLVNGLNSLYKVPYALVLHGENDRCMKLFYEEIIEPLFNSVHCEKLVSEKLDEKSLPKQLDEKIVYNFHNITVPTIMDEPATELTNRLIYKDEYKLNNKIITTAGSLLITSTTKYIPLISIDVPCLVVSVESSLMEFCKDKNISTNYYEVANYIKYDLDNFMGIVRSIDLYRLNNPCNTNFYNGDSDDGIIDGDVEILEVFNAAFINKDYVFFETLKTKYKKLHDTLIFDLKENKVNRKKLIEYFIALFGKNIYKETQNRKLISDLRELSSTTEPFENTKPDNDHGTVYYNL